MDFFSIELIAFTVFDYPISYIELIGTLFGLLSVILAARANILTWPTGIINEVFFLLLFFQVQLYADMLLQVYFFVMTLYGWFYWNSDKKEHRIGVVSTRNRLTIILLLLMGTAVCGFVISRLHVYLSDVFVEPAAFPYIDSFTTVASIIAMVLLARKRLEAWVLWIAVDIVSVCLYVTKGINLIAMEYLVFLAIATYGFFHWKSKIEG